MKKIAKPIDWASVAQKMAADKRRIEAAVGSNASKIPDGIKFVHPFTLPADRS